MEFAGDFATISGERREMIDCQARMLHIPIKKTGFSSPRLPEKAASVGNTLMVSGAGTRRSAPHSVVIYLN